MVYSGVNFLFLFKMFRVPAPYRMLFGLCLSKGYGIVNSVRIFVLKLGFYFFAWVRKLWCLYFGGLEFRLFETGPILNAERLMNFDGTVGFWNFRDFWVNFTSIIGSIGDTTLLIRLDWGHTFTLWHLVVNCVAFFHYVFELDCIAITREIG